MYFLKQLLTALILLFLVVKPTFAASSPVTITQLLTNWLTSTFDQNGDGKVNSLDFAILIGLTPSPSPTSNQVVAISAGRTQSLALKADGTVVGWGCQGENNGSCTIPVGLNNVTALATGRYHSLALKSNGTVVAWGCLPAGGVGDAGQCIVPAGLSGVVAIGAGVFQSSALKSDHTVVTWGCQDIVGSTCSTDASCPHQVLGSCQTNQDVIGPVTITIASPAKFTKVAHGLSTNKVVSFSTTGALPTGLVQGQSYYVIAAGLTADTFEVSLTQGGAAVNTSGTQAGADKLRFPCPSGGACQCHTSSDFGQCDPIIPPAQCTSDANCGGVVGSCQAGQCLLQGHFTQIGTGDDENIALLDNGGVYYWGCGSNHPEGQTCTLPSDSVYHYQGNTSSVGAGGSHSMLLKNDGSVVDWGCASGAISGCTAAHPTDPSICSCVVPVGLVASQVSAGWYHDVALKTDGTVASYGCITSSNGANTASNGGQCTTPVGLINVIQVAGGFAHSMALKSNGTVVAWGCQTAIVGTCTTSTDCQTGAPCVNGQCNYTFDFGQCTVPADISGN